MSVIVVKLTNSSVVLGVVASLVEFGVLVKLVVRIVSFGSSDSVVFVEFTVV